MVRIIIRIVRRTRDLHLNQEDQSVVPVEQVLVLVLVEQQLELVQGVQVPPDAQEDWYVSSVQRILSILEC